MDYEKITTKMKNCLIEDADLLIAMDILDIIQEEPGINAIVEDSIEHIKTIIEKIQHIGW